MAENNYQSGIDVADLMLTASIQTTRDFANIWNAAEF